MVTKLEKVTIQKKPYDFMAETRLRCKEQDEQQIRELKATSADFLLFGPFKLREMALRWFLQM